jgi:hypothetical protein
MEACDKFPSLGGRTKAYQGVLKIYSLPLIPIALTKKLRD